MAIKTFSQIVASMLSRIRTAQPTADTKVGTFIRDIVVDPPANELSIFYTEADRISKAQSPDTAQGADVVRLAENFGLHRKAATRATGEVTFYTHTAPASDIVIPRGTLVSTVAFANIPSIPFATTETVTLPATGVDAYYNTITGRYEISAPIQASNSGEKGNVAAGAISVVVSAVPGIQGCTNVSALTGGTDQEEIEALRTRLRTALLGNGVVTASGIEQAVAAVEGVSDLNITTYSTIPGTVVVTIKGTDAVSVSEDIDYYSTQESYVFLSQPVSSTGSILVVGTVSGTLTEDTDYSIEWDTGMYGGTTLGRTKIVWLTSLPDQTITVSYAYNALVSDIQALFDDSTRKALGQSVLIKAAKPVAVDVGARIRLLPGYSFGTTTTGVQGAIITALTQSLGTYTIGQSVQQSDIVAVIAAVPGVDEVQVPLATFSAEGITPNEFGDLEIPSDSYASVGTLTISQ